MKADREAVDTDAVDQIRTSRKRVVLQIPPGGADQSTGAVRQVERKVPRAGARDRDSSLSSLDRTH